MKIEINKYEQPMDRLNGSNFRTSILTIAGDLAHVKSTKRARLKLYLFILMCSLFYFFIALSMFIHRVATRSHNFNLSKGIYFFDKRRVELKSLVGIQVIRKRIYGNSTNFDSHELNLVSNSGERINIIEHSKGDYVKLEASKLAEFLSLEESYLDCRN